MAQPDYLRLRMLLNLLVAVVDDKEDDRIIGYGLEFSDAIDDFMAADWGTAGPIVEERDRIKALDHGGGYAEDE